MATTVYEREIGDGEVEAEEPGKQVIEKRTEIRKRIGRE